MRRLFLPFILVLFYLHSAAQIKLKGNSGSSGDPEYSNPKEYEIGGITVSGTQFLDVNALINLSGLTVGDKIKVPGDKISGAIHKLWKQELFGDINIEITKIQDGKVFLNLNLKEKPRLSKFSFSGIKKSDADDIRDKIKLIKGRVVNENLISNTKNTIYNFYKEKGFLNAKVIIKEEVDTTLTNSEILKINIKKGKKVRIQQVLLSGNVQIPDKKIKRWLKNTKERQVWNIFRSSKFNEKKFEEDKDNVLEKLNTLGYRDAKIISDSVYKISEQRLNVALKIHEGPKYHFGNITFTGNTKYKSAQLAQILGIKKGDIYDKSALNSRISGSATGNDISSLYLDDGYLFFNITPVETQVYKDTIDLEIRMSEGSQATINKITIHGNEKTNDKVILRELRTKPGQKFSRSDIIRTQQALLALGYFDPQKFNVTPKPNPADGTVDIDYIVEEKPSDQISLSGGYGANRIIGTLQLTLTNFSARNVFHAKEWDPIPTGDGQRISLAAQTNGLYYQSYSASFTEPWLGGKKPNSFTLTAFKTIRTNGALSTSTAFQSIHIDGISTGLGKRLRFPDDYFTLNSTLTFQRYLINNYPGFFINNGSSYQFNLTEALSRSSIDQPIYPTGGSIITLSLSATPPYSLFKNKNYTDLPAEQKYKLTEFYKWKFDVSWYTRIFKKLVLNTKAQFGYLGYYNKEIGTSPFERFQLGGDGLYALNYLVGGEAIALRGYPNYSVIPNANFQNMGSPLFNKFTLELRQPLTLNQSATIYMLGFVEGGNTYAKFGDFTPFDLKRSAGFGVRIFLPIFGMLGLDYGWRLDQLAIPVQEKGQFHFSIGQQF